MGIKPDIDSRSIFFIFRIQPRFPLGLPSPPALNEIILTPAFVWGGWKKTVSGVLYAGKTRTGKYLHCGHRQIFCPLAPIVSQFTAADPFLAHLSFCLSRDRRCVCERVKPWCSCSSPGIPSPFPPPPPLPPTCLSHRLSILTFSQTSLDLCVTRHCLSLSLIALPSRFRAATIVEICMRRAAKQRIWHDITA